jgi:acetyl/propionyl-CoA carboxylase alpha subunit
MSFSKVLIANRGEISLRVARTCRDMGLRSVAVFTPPDRGAPHVEDCDEALEIPSYLDIPAIVAAAKKAGAEAIHPGYGFLSQSAKFAEACEEAGVVFVGPTPDALRRMGDKQESRRTAEAAGVPVTPGTPALKDRAAILDAARKLGLPVMLKAVAGGGGKGIRRIEKEDGLEAEIDAARREAEGAFGDGRLFVEKLIPDARHVEVQVLGDRYGRVFALGERDCSLQRRFQKIIEESPSSAVDAALRARLEEAAVRLARAAGYVNAGTVEFLLQPDGSFFFMEMNTRLQVEHPVTELVLGIDLVRLQLEVAQGATLSPPPAVSRGHAIEARLCAEDPDGGFLPMTGKVLKLAWPSGIRIEHALREGLEIGPDYDPMLAKLIAWGADREEARRRLSDALRRTLLLGIQTNQSYLLRLLETPEFARSEILANRLPAVPPEELPLAAWAAAVGPSRSAGTKRRVRTAWETLGRWRIGG